MEGWKLNEGKCTDIQLTEDEIWSIFNHLFSTKSVNRTSYKFGFLKALLESAFDVNVDGCLSLTSIFKKFTQIYWTLIMKHNLVQGDKGTRGGKTSIEKIFEEVAERYPLIKQCFSYDLIDKNIKKEIDEQTFKECSRYVVGALYGDTKQHFYSFSKKQDYLRFNKSFLKFIKKYNKILLKLNHYEWITFLEKVNPEENSYSIATKLDQSSKRSSLKEYKDFLFIEYKNQSCFYCGKKINYDSIHVDHVIPWSFLRNDRLWNFVLACPKCNITKNDKLPNSSYFKAVMERDERLKDIRHSLVIEDFKIYSRDNYVSMYNSAIFNGFDSEWTPKIFVKHKEICQSDKNTLTSI